MILQPRNRAPRYTPEDLAAQILAQQPHLIHQAARQEREAERTAGSVRIGPRPVEAMNDAPPAPASPGIQLEPRTKLPPAPVAAVSPGQMTEAQVRDEARRRGVSEEAAAEKWRTLAPPANTPMLPPPSGMSEMPTPAALPVVKNSFDPPPPGSVDEAENSLREAQGRKVVDKNGRFKSGVRNALYGLGQTFGRRPANNWQELAHGLSYGVGSGVAGAIDPTIDEERAKLADIERFQGQFDQRTKDDANRASIKFRNAQADYTAARPGLEERKSQIKLLIDQEKARLGNRRMTETERHNGAAEVLRGQGLIDAREYRESRLKDYDEDREQRGQFEAGRDDDRDDARAATQARFEKTFGLANERFGSAEAQRLFTTKTKGSFERLRSLKTQIEKYQTATAKAEMRPETARARIVELETEAARVSDEIESARSEALGGGSSNARPAAAGARSYTEDEVRARARTARRDPEAAVRAARERGLVKD
jgi:hypothetical protein